MHKRLWLFLVSIVFLCGFHIAQASVIINEIQISPTDGRFIELYNQDNTEVDLTDWYIQRKTSSGSSFGSLITKTYFENKKIAPNEFFVISKNSLNNSNLIVDSLTITDSNTIQLKNQNGDVVDKFSFGDSNECSGNCPNNPSEGNSLQLIDGSWTTAFPTAGFANKTSGNTNVNNNITEQKSIYLNNSVDKNTVTKTKTIENPSMKLNILVNNIIFAEQSTLFHSSIFGYKDEKIVLGKLYWNFGDGTSFEQINKFEKFYKTYDYPGEYSVSLEYYPNNFTDTPEIVSKMTVKVVPLTVSISKVGDINDFFVELTNNSSYDIDISKWVLSSLNKTFIFPKNSVILAKKQMTVSSKITGLLLRDKDNLKLNMPNGELVYMYKGEGMISKTKNNDIKLIRNKEETSIVEDMNVDEEKLKIDLEASAIDNKVNLIGNDINFAFIFGLVILLGVAGSMVYFLRQKKNIKKVGDDFEILDE